MLSLRKQLPLYTGAFHRWFLISSPAQPSKWLKNIFAYHGSLFCKFTLRSKRNSPREFITQKLKNYSCEKILRRMNATWRLFLCSFQDSKTEGFVNAAFDGTSEKSINHFHHVSDSSSAGTASNLNQNIQVSKPWHQNLLLHSICTLKTRMPLRKSRNRERTGTAPSSFFSRAFLCRLV